MRDARRTTFCCAIALLLSAFPAAAQSSPNGLSTDSVDPRADASTIREIRRRLDRIRSTQKRPTVALVLSGGGAKGAAQVGAIKYIEELGIPIDFVCGTSIGGLVGGFYAVGYRSDDLAELFREQDWNIMLTDRIPTSFVPYSTKMGQATYLVSFPFHHPATGGEEQGFYTLHEQRRSLDGPGTGRTLLNSLSSSLPAGYANGFNVNNLLSSMMVGYQDSTSFARLPIPYMCVAGDVVSSFAKNWGSGNINTAMRSTMSIPGLFNPVRIGNMVLVDGGVRNNFPTDIAKAVGADYVIGIELSDAQPDYSEVNNIGEILGRFIAMLGTDTFAKNVGKCDVFIKPPLDEFNMMSFNATAVDTMLLRGYRAAQEQHDALINIRQRTGRVRNQTAGRRPATDISKTPVRLSAIEYNGVNEKEAARLARITALDINAPLDKKTIDEAMYRLQATGAFESITYSLYGRNEPYRLVFHCNPAPIHDFALGLRADSQEGAALLMSIGLGVHRLSGSKLDVTARIAQNQRFSAHYALDLADLPTFNVAATFARYRGNLGSEHDHLRYDVTYFAHREEFYVSGLDWTQLDLRAGIINRAYKIHENTLFAQMLKQEGLPLAGDYIGVYLQSNLYTLDNHYFPTRGFSLMARAHYDFIQPGSTSFTPILRGCIDFRSAIPLTDQWAIVPDVRLRTISHFGEEVVDDVSHTNYVGGLLAARYVDDQLPFFGLHRVIATGDYLINAVASVRWNPLKDFYLSAMGGMLIHDNELPRLFSRPVVDTWALGVEAAYNLPVGPIKLNLHWSNQEDWGASIAIGFDF